MSDNSTIKGDKEWTEKEKLQENMEMKELKEVIAEQFLLVCF